MSDWDNQETSFGISLSYARADEEYAAAIVEHLRQLAPGGLASTWFDRQIAAGSSWEAEIERRMAKADVIVMLISHSYLSSEFINERELRMIQAARERGAGIWPVLVGECAWQAHPRISALQFFSGGELLRAPTTKTFKRQVARLVVEIADFLAARLEASSPAATAPAPVTPPPAAGEGRDAGARDDEFASKGSKRQIQIYVSRHEREFTDTVVGALPLDGVGSIDWRSPLAADGYAEYRDDRFLKAIGLGSWSGKHKDFWPRPGPVWDGLGLIEGDRVAGGKGVVLVEAKAYPAEMESQCKARAKGSLERIRGALGWMESVAGLSAGAETWMARRYQLANRLAHAFWLREQVGVDAWLVLAAFSDDLEHRPTSSSEWEADFAALYADFGLGELVGDVIIPVVLPAIQL